MPTTAPGRPWCMPIVETLAAVEEIDDILKLERVDLIYIGSYDLSAQLGVTGRMDAPELTRVVDRILAACRQAGKPAALMVLTEEAARMRNAMGVQTLVHGVDSHRVKQAMTGIVAPLRELRPPDDGLVSATS